MSEADDKPVGTKTTAAEYDRFLEADWKELGMGEEPYIEEDEIYVDGKLDAEYEPGKYPPETKLQIGGCIRDGKNFSNNDWDLSREFKKWQKKLRIHTFVIEIDEQESLRDECKRTLQQLLKVHYEGKAKIL